MPCAYRDGQTSSSTAFRMDSCCLILMRRSCRLPRRSFGDVTTRLQLPVAGQPVIRYRQPPASLVRHALIQQGFALPIIMC